MHHQQELDNFKSYAGLQCIGPFHKYFSAVVGPNGSGKSNVIDAMLFVFGKRAKQLRLRKVNELIHKSRHYPNLEYAKVNVHFHEIIDTGPGDDEYEIVPHSQCVISRIAKRDNTSSYYVNHRPCPFKEVVHYLAAHGIDLDNNRFLILQGEVEMISMMPPIGKNGNDDGLLEYLEDLIGSTKFVQPTVAAAATVEQCNTLRQEKLNRVKSVEQEKEALVGAKQEAEALLSKDRQIRSHQNRLYQFYRHEAHLEWHQYQSEHAIASATYQTERDNYTAEQERISQLEELYRTEKSSYEIIHKELITTKNEFQAYERRDIKLREQLKHAKSKRQKMVQKISELDVKMEVGQTAMTAATTNIPGFETKRAELVSRQSEQDDALQTLQEQVRGTTQLIRTQLEQTTKQLVPFQHQKAVVQAAYDTVNAQIALLENGPLRATSLYTAASNELHGLDATQSNKRVEREEAVQNLATAQSRFHEIIHRLEPSRAQNETRLVDQRTHEMVRY
jgi:structural maintenance of chromosome 4